MNKPTRIAYHARHWPAACEAQGWDPRDQDKRRDVCLECMVLVGGPAITTSHAKWGNAETSALFLRLQHLADPDNITLSMEWDNCQAGYVAYNMSKQADHYQVRTYGHHGAGRLGRQRFAGRKTAKGYPAEDPLTREEAQVRLTTMRSRATRKFTLHENPKSPSSHKSHPDPDLCPF